MSYELQTLEVTEPTVSSQSQAQSKPFDPGLISLVTKISREAALDAAMMLSASEEKARHAFWEKIKSEIDKLERPKPQVLAVKHANGETVKLSSPAPSFLGEMLDMHAAGLNILLVGPAGCGKSKACEIFAESLKLPFSCFSFSAGASETWLLGRHLPKGWVPAAFCERYEHGGVFCADEADAGDMNLWLLLNNAISGNSFYNPMEGRTIEKHKDFIFVATANTFLKGGDMVYCGRNPLDGSTNNRFWKIKVDYNRDLERELCPDQKLCKMLWGMRETLSKLESQEIISMRQFIGGYALIQKAGWSYRKIFETITLGWQEEITLACRKSLEKIEKEEAKADKPDSEIVAAVMTDELAKTAQEIEKLKAENSELQAKQGERKAFGRK